MTAAGSSPTTLDAVFAGGNVYPSKVLDAGGVYYGGMSVQRVGLATLDSAEIYSHAGVYPNAWGNRWFDWIALHDGKLVSTNAAFGVELGL